MAIAFGAALSSGARDFSLSGGRDGDDVRAVMLIVFGGRLIRNDLRHDMLHLPLLKSVPIPLERYRARRGRVVGVADGGAAARASS